MRILYLDSLGTFATKGNGVLLSNTPNDLQVGFADLASPLPPEQRRVFIYITH